MTDTTPTTQPPDQTTPSPRPGECLLCFIARTVSQHGCDNTLRWARRWRTLRLPRATDLERRLRARGGYCDCEILLDGWALRAELDEDDEDAAAHDPVPCPGVPSRSSEPCAQWVDVGRGRW
jgi:hypothetical protein